MLSNISHTDACLSLGLAFVGGYGDAASFVLAKTFTGHVTGNLVSVAGGQLADERLANGRQFRIYDYDEQWHHDLLLDYHQILCTQKRFGKAEGRMSEMNKCLTLVHLTSRFRIQLDRNSQGQTHLVFRPWLLLRWVARC